MPGDLLGLRPRVLRRHEDLPHVRNERRHRIRGGLRHGLSPLCAVSLNRPPLLWWSGHGVKHMHGPSRGADPNTIPARLIFLAGSEATCSSQRVALVSGGRLWQAVVHQVRSAEGIADQGPAMHRQGARGGPHRAKSEILAKETALNFPRSLNVSEFVGGGSEGAWARGGIEEVRLFARDQLWNGGRCTAPQPVFTGDKL
jgi:hypothetical protein